MTRLSRLVVGLCAGAAASAATSAMAHFTLNAPPAMYEQNFLGDPQKAPPCGVGSGISGVETGIVTTFEAGSSITIKLNETIWHPGHYRVSIAPEMSMLPPEPPVTADSSSPCGSAPIDPNPVWPVLADGLLVHTSPLSGEQTVEVQLPPGMTCDNCVLQVLEFMSDHVLNVPGGCYYHHCAKVSIVAAGSGDDAGAGGGPDAGPGNGGDGDDAGGSDSGGCAAGGRAGGLDLAGFVLVALGALAARRRFR